MFSTSKTQALKACTKLQAKIKTDNIPDAFFGGIGVGVLKGEGDYVIFVYIKTNRATPSPEMMVWLKQIPPKIDGVKIIISLIGDVKPL